MTENIRDLNETEIIARYKDAPTTRLFGGTALTLAEVLEMEAMFCPADPALRTDPKARIDYLATILGEEQLLPPPGCGVVW